VGGAGRGGGGGGGGGGGLGGDGGDGGGARELFDELDASDELDAPLLLSEGGRSERPKPPPAPEEEGSTRDGSGPVDSRRFRFRSLARSPRVAAWARVAVPLAILGNAALFVSSNTSVGASVLVRLAYRPGAAASKTLTPETLTPPPVFSFTLANSVRDMWRAGVYPLAALIGVFSGGWPYLKLFLMLIAWVANPGAGPRFGFDAARVETLRGDALSALDALGKWSLVDAFVMILFRAAFAFRLEAADEDGNRVAIDAEVRPEYGFQSFLLATVLSLALGHVASAWHREDRERAEEARQATTPFGDEGVGGAIEDRGARRAASDADGALPSSDMTRASNETTRVSSYRDSDSDGAPRVATRHSAASRAEDVAVAGGLIFAAGLLVIGAHADAIRFDFEGAAGAALGPTRASRTFSLVALARALPPASSAALVLVAFTVAAPLARVAVALALWLAPTTKRERRLARVAEETLGAWSALDACVLSAVAAALQIGRFAAFIVGDGCAFVDARLRQAAAFGAARGMDDPFGLRGDDTCFDVAATPTGGCWVLVLAVIIAEVAARRVRATARRLDEGGGARRNREARKNARRAEREVEELLGGATGEETRSDAL